MLRRYLKRLSNNELGRTGGHQRGGVLVTKEAVRHFPPLGDGANPEFYA